MIDTDPQNYEDDYDDFGDPQDNYCECCGGDGHVELQDHPELWGEDCFVEMNRLVVCPECGGKGFYD
jgi:DnaJ-class molecular chaperone